MYVRRECINLRGGREGGELFKNIHNGITMQKKPGREGRENVVCGAKLSSGGMNAWMGKGEGGRKIDEMIERGDKRMMTCMKRKLKRCKGREGRKARWQVAGKASHLPFLTQSLPADAKCL